MYMATKEKPRAKSLTIRQKMLAKNLSESIGKPMGRAMLEVGYSKEYSENPQQLTNTKSWQQLLEEYLPDSLLAEKHHELLNKQDKFGEVDSIAVPRGLDMAYKLKDKYSPERIDHRVTHYSDLPDEELERLYNARINSSTTPENY